MDTRALTIRIRDGGAPNAACSPFRLMAGLTRVHCKPRQPRGPVWRAWTSPAQVSCTQTYRWDETEWAWPDGSRRQIEPQASRRRGRLRGQAQHPALPGLRWVPRDRGAGDRDSGGHSAPSAGRRVPLERSGRPGGHSRVRRPRHPGRAGCWRAAIRHLPRAPIAGAGVGGANLQARSRPSRREPAGEGSGDRTGGDHQPEPRLRGRWRIRCRRARK